MIPLSERPSAYLAGTAFAYQKPRCIEGKREWGGLDPSTYTRSQLFLFLRKHSSIEIVDMHLHYLCQASYSSFTMLT